MSGNGMPPRTGAKPKLLVVAGAGATADFCMPTVCDVNDICKKAAEESFSVDGKHSSNLYAYMEKTIHRYKCCGPQPNFEDILYTLFTLMSASKSPLGAFVHRNRFPRITRSENSVEVDEHVFRHLAAHLLDDVLKEFRSRCLRRNGCPVELERFFKELSDQFEIAVVTTNYDDLIYRSLPQAARETGFEFKSLFRPGRILGRSDWPCILHLHGSVHFDMRYDDVQQELHRIYWQDDLNNCSPNAIGRSTQRLSGGQEFPTTVIIAGYGKSQQILRHPFRTYYSEFDRLVSESDAVLFLGYGFGDDHLNLAFADYRDARNRPVVIVDYADDNVLTTRSCQECSPTAHKAMEIFKVLHGQMSWLGYKFPNSLEPLRDAKEFERSERPDAPLSFWYNGILAACRNPDKIVEELSGAQGK